LALDQEYLPPSQEFRITGRQPTVLKVKDRSEIRGKFELRLASTSDGINRQQARDDSTILMQAAMNPMALQSGIIGMKGVRQTYEDFYKAYGKDPSFYIEDKAAIRSPEEELMMFAVGQYVGPVPGEDFNMHMMAHEASLQLPYVPPEVKGMLRKHMQETRQMAMTMQMAQMGGEGAGPPPGQQATNAQTGAQPQPQQPSGQTTQGAGVPAPSPAGPPRG
jgi:hypothetical protein